MQMRGCTRSLGLTLPYRANSRGRQVLSALYGHDQPLTVTITHAHSLAVSGLIMASSKVDNSMDGLLACTPRPADELLLMLGPRGLAIVLKYITSRELFESTHLVVEYLYMYSTPLG